MHALELRFHKHIQNRFQLKPQHQVVLGFSGGPDSVALALLLKSFGCTLHLAHVNYQLRGANSMQDETFCIAFSKQHNIPLHVKRLKPNWLKKGLNLQTEARGIRYAWFDACKRQFNLQLIATAHHADDLTETVFRNWIHGTGIIGFSGIAEHRADVIRPLLPFTKIEILEYLRYKKIKYQIDESNLKPNYERNHIRLNIIPKIQTLNPNLQHTIYKNSTVLQTLVGGIEAHLKVLSVPVKNGFQLQRSLNKYTILDLSVLGFAFNEWGCSYIQIQELLKLLKPDTVFKPRTFYTKSHHIYVERDDILIYNANASKTKFEYVFQNMDALKNHNMFKVNILKQKPKTYKNDTLYCCLHKLKFPLLLRHKKTADAMQPFGMNGHKLISDIIREQKLSQFNKDLQLLLCDNENEILWILPYKTSNYLKINSNDPGPYVKIKFKS